MCPTLCLLVIDRCFFLSSPKLWVTPSSICICPGLLRTTDLFAPFLAALLKASASVLCCATPIEHFLYSLLDCLEISANFVDYSHRRLAPEPHNKPAITRMSNFCHTTDISKLFTCWLSLKVYWFHGAESYNDSLFVSFSCANSKISFILCDGLLLSHPPTSI